jgi:hypothetical protein
LQFRRSANAAKDYSDPWDAACQVSGKRVICL